MRLNPRYVFFRTAPDDGKEPVGSAGVSLPPGRAIAVDPSRHAMGSLYWLDAAAPKLSGAFPTYRRLAVALDTGGAIKGDARADLYMGTGDAAGAEAGRVRHALRLYRLVPTPRS
jgi:membrane-bound lytic murein transglycosylase A